MADESFSVRLLGDPVLRDIARPVEAFDESLERFVKKMSRTLLDARVGIGLAAPQVGFSIRVFVYDAQYVGGPPAGVLINPAIVETKGKETDHEACLSFAGEYFPIQRRAKVEVRAQNLRGEFFEFSADGLMARLVQHEVDHLNGVVIVDHIPERERLRATRDFMANLRAAGLPATAHTATMKDVDVLFGRALHD
jgi:peptide deformylase